MNLWIQQRGLCWICREPMHRFGVGYPGLQVSRDHLLPAAHGGRSRLANYLLAHRYCNSKRGAPVLTIAQVRQIREQALAELEMSESWIGEFPDSGKYRGLPRASA